MFGLAISNKEITMKKVRKLLVTAISCFVLVATIAIAFPKEALAGFSNLVIDNSSFAQELDTSKWHVPNKDVVAKDGKIVFPSASTAHTKLIMAEPIRNSEMSDTLFTVDCTMGFTQLPVGQKFVLGLSLATIESGMEEPGNVEVVFTNKQGIRVAVVAYNNDGDRVTLANVQNIGTNVGGNFKVNVSATKNNKLVVKVNDKTICTKQSPVELTGRIGFLQTGSCGAEISNLNIHSYRYDTPENANIFEDFESGSINVNLLQSTCVAGTGQYPAGAQVEEYGGSNVMMFRNANVAHIGTVYKYSNFEATFDVPYILHNSVVDEDGNILSPATLDWAFVIGADVPVYQAVAQEWIYASDALIFNSTHVYSYRHIYEGILTSIFDKGIFDNSKNEGYSVKISVIDTIVTLSMKALDAKEWIEITSYKMGNETPTGHIHIVSGNGRANFAIDNLRIVNKDQNAKTIEVGFKSGDEGLKDWEYVPMEVKYRDGNTLEGENGIEVEDNKVTEKNFIQEAMKNNTNWFYVTGGIVAVSILLVVSVLLATRKKKVKRGVNNEEV